jgi:hypothetical protein
MQARSIDTDYRRAAMLGRAVVLAAIVLASGCAQILGIEDLPPLDAGPSGFAVRGTAIGVLGPVALELRIDGDSKVLTVMQDGMFAFAPRLETGASYAVVLVNTDVPCTLRNEIGMIAGADAAIELTCTVPALASVAVSGIAPPTVTLVPDMTDYSVDLSLLQQSVTLTATVAIAGHTLTIAGTPVDSGASSAEITLNLGDNHVDIVVENAVGWQRTYRLTLRRAAQIAQHAYGKASNTGANERFGFSVALSGDTLAVGAVWENSAATGVNGNQADNSAMNSGAVYVFRRTGAAWQQEAYLKASNTGNSDQFGISVALSGDTLAVGAHVEDSAATGVDGNQGDDAGGTNSGAVYVFRRSGTTWLQEAYLKASNTDALDYFGVSVALSGDTLAVGAYGEDSETGAQADNSATDSGAVYVFRHNGTTWLQEAYLKASTIGVDDYFGHDVALSGDTLAVVAWGEDSAATDVGGDENDNTAADSGAVYVFRRAGTTWQQEAYLKASNTGTEDYFGYTGVALSGDTLAVGAEYEDSAAQGVGGDENDNTAADSGAVYVFRRTGAAWEQEAYLKASNTGTEDRFGWSVALSGDTLAVGAVCEDSAAQGVGGNQDDNVATENSGAVYVFRRTGTAWEQAAYIKASNTAKDDTFGRGVALSGDTLAVTAIQEDSAATGVNSNQDDNNAMDSGAVYVFH